MRLLGQFTCEVKKSNEHVKNNKNNKKTQIFTIASTDSIAEDEGVGPTFENNRNDLPLALWMIIPTMVPY